MRRLLRPIAFIQIFMLMLLCVSPLLAEEEEEELELWQQSAAPPVPAKTEYGGTIAPAIKEDFIGELAKNAYAPLYGELLNAHGDSLKPILDEAFKASAAGDTSKLAAATAFREGYEALDRANKAFGYFLTALSATEALAKGEYTEAGEAVALQVIGDLAGSQAGKSMLAAAGLTTIPVSAALVAYSVWRASVKGLEASTKSLNMEVLYYKIAADKSLRSTGRELGEGNPIPPNKANVDRVWQRILQGGEMQELFKLYLTEKLNKEWPEPSFWEVMQVSGAFDIKSYIFPSFTPDSQKLQEFQTLNETKVKEKEGELKQCVGSLIAELNDYARAEEQRVVAKRQIAALQAQLKKLQEKLGDQEFQRVVMQYGQALQKIPQVEDFIRLAPGMIDNGVKKDDVELLLGIRYSTRGYVETVVRYLPEGGKIGEKRKQLLDGLRKTDQAVTAALKKFLQDSKAKVEKPKPTPPPPTAAPATVQDFNIAVPTAQSMYTSTLAPILKPFDWGGGSPDEAREKFAGYLQKGQFRAGGDPATLPRGRTAAANCLLRAWELQNFTYAFSSDVEKGEANNVPAPEKGVTIKEYERILSEKITNSPLPPELAGIKAQIKALEDQIAPLADKYYRLTQAAFAIKSNDEDSKKTTRSAVFASGTARRTNATIAGCALPTQRPVKASDKGVGNGAEYGI